MKRYAQVLLDNPTGTTADGNLIVVDGGLEWQDVEWLDPWDCGHVTEMCAGCVDAWSIDHEIRLPDGIDVPDEGAE